VSLYYPNKNGIATSIIYGSIIIDKAAIASNLFSTKVDMGSAI
jgi:hypothetical protein